jgi:thiamine pyrophosphate-dependent acetolactate synthase large subunit-like protein
MPGPVAIVVSEDALTATAKADVVAPQVQIHAALRADDVAALRRLIAEAARPLVLAGRSLDPARRPRTCAGSSSNGTCQR